MITGVGCPGVVRISRRNCRSQHSWSTSVCAADDPVRLGFQGRYRRGERRSGALFRVHQDLAEVWCPAGPELLLEAGHALHHGCGQAAAGRCSDAESRVCSCACESAKQRPCNRGHSIGEVCARELLSGFPAEGTAKLTAQLQSPRLVSQLPAVSVKVCSAKQLCNFVVVCFAARV